MSADAIHVLVKVFTILPAAALILLIGLWIFAIIRIPGRPRLALLIVGCLVFLLAAVLFGGQWLLELHELAWRQWVKSVFALLLWCAGFAVSSLTVYWIPRAVRSGRTVLRRCLRAAAALCLMIAMGCGTIWGGLWLSPVSETVIVYHRVKAVQEESNWLDYYCAIYEYHGPFVRGARAIGPIGG